MSTKDATGVDFSKCVGFKYDPVPVRILFRDDDSDVPQVSWNKREILLFANSVGVEPQELHLLYELRGDTINLLLM